MSDKPKLKPLSLKINNKLGEKVKQYAQDKGVSVIKLVSDLVKNHLECEVIDVDTQEKLKSYAKTKGVSVSKLVCDLADRYLTVEEDVIPVIIKIPSRFKGDPESLKVWLSVKAEAIVKALT